MITKPLHTIIVKTVGSKCNLDCTYCFYLNKELKYETETVMDSETLRVFMKQVMEDPNQQTGIVWQGGEPTLAGVDFYQQAISYMLEYGKNRHKTISNLLQTNGFYISDPLVKLLKKYSFLVGLSLDGPEEIHDYHRKTKGGDPTFRQVMQSWNKLKEAEVETNILCCITSSSASKAAALYSFFKSHKMNWLQFIPVSEKDQNGMFNDFSVSPEGWGSFMQQIFDLWYSDFERNEAPQIRFIENAFQMMVGLPSPECTFTETCGDYVVLEHNGDVYSCDYFVNQHTLLGNIHQKTLKEMLNSAQQYQFGEIKKQLPPECVSCPFISYCNGGCPKYKDERTQKYHFCTSWKMFLEHAYPKLKPIADQFIKEHPLHGKTLDLSGYL
jgi:uncharacterized protein